MKVYVIIVTFNGIKWIENCLSTLAMSTMPVQTIVIDNGSTDATVEVVSSKFPKVKVVATKTNLGFGRANNIGIKFAYDQQADFFFLLNQDAWITDDTISKIIQAHSVNLQFGIVSPMHLNGKGNALDLNFSNCLSPWSCPSFVSDMYLGKLERKIYDIKFVNAAAWMISRSCIETVGGFNPTFFQYGEDDNYIHRVFYHGFKIGVLPHTVIYHDREDRNENAYFDPDQHEKRNRLLHFSNPITSPSVSLEIKKYRKEYVKHLMKFNAKKLKQTSEMIRELTHYNKTLSDLLPKSKNKGLTFLDNVMDDFHEI